MLTNINCFPSQLHLIFIGKREECQEPHVINFHNNKHRILPQSSRKTPTTGTKETATGDEGERTDREPQPRETKEPHGKGASREFQKGKVSQH
ncbi:hypothetical protein KFK09_022600 [Dendrobium nobile]|uniref:Uncharacterized protein n=1 Tax=Dendrobium nobile TaxID=94219 RepID=A0A8T3AIA2_DENNO|nr:hypothetical protein KFK09_022600 [Dendrobium nobile]